MRAANLLILLCVITTFYTWNVDSTVAERDLIFSLRNIQEMRVWTLVTAIFVHANMMHLIGNMIFLYVFGNTLESVENPRRMLSAFFLGGTLSFVLGFPFFPADSTFAGASGAIFTLTAIVMLIKPLRFSWLLLMPVGLVAVLYFVYNALAVYYNMQGSVAYVSHIIGFLLGVPLGIAWSPKWKRNLLISIGLVATYFAAIYLITTYLLSLLP